jgi:hypothetical protein
MLMIAASVIVHKLLSCCFWSCFLFVFKVWDFCFFFSLLADSVVRSEILITLIITLVL